ncbi:NUDIX hydrolase [Rossellomorea aquimaris]|uniref:NUDIX hydrolase n=1 Tax=Rossellomorea aquimaris TaxID=189382 RepID=UPI001CD7AE47|nr:NUDIX hydrolase [Rossellomorea aquimaris]MCA1058545.1 NUDIX hydrolase [Rossellomorea aquimaris]
MGYIEELRKVVGTRPLILVGAVAIILNEKDEVLLQQRRFPMGTWGLPGGLMELAESTEETARREVVEETGLQLGELHLLNVYSGADQYIKAENGDEFYVVTTAYFTNEFHGEMIADPSESIHLTFYPFDSLPQAMVGSHRNILNEYQERFIKKDDI